MPSNSMTVDEFLAVSPQMECLATIEPVSGDDTKIKVTPWVPNLRCWCGASITVSKTIILEVEPTGELASCCGRTLRVVRIKAAASVPLSEVLSAMASTVAGSRPGTPHVGRYGRPTFSIFERLPPRVPDPHCYRICIDSGYSQEFCRQACSSLAWE